MNEKQLTAVDIKGKSIRTDNNNVEEIIGLWSGVSEMGLIGNIYAVYSNYESDHLGKYDLLIGNEAYQSQQQVRIESGDYMEFFIKEGTPENIAKQWQKIWQDSIIYEKRIFSSDFEYYLTDGSAYIFLAINEKG